MDCQVAGSKRWKVKPAAAQTHEGPCQWTINAFGSISICYTFLWEAWGLHDNQKAVIGNGGITYFCIDLLWNSSTLHACADSLCS
jgi:hypothetical protein